MSCAGPLKRVRLPVPKAPSIRLEKEWTETWGGPVAGVDEAGRGPLAGPVVAAAVILPLEGRRPVGLDDSKQLTHTERERLYPQIIEKALAYGIGIATAQEIDSINILEATRLAASRAIAAMAVQPVGFVTDCLELPREKRPVLPVIKGDAISSSIAAASILAKVTRDRMMDHYHSEFPGYGWDTNRGYPTEVHLEALMAHGPTVLHRLTFSGVSFFTCEPLRSPSYLRLRQGLAEAKARGEAAALDEWFREVRECRHRLPPPDFRDLCTDAGIIDDEGAVD